MDKDDSKIRLADQANGLTSMLNISVALEIKNKIYVSSTSNIYTCLDQLAYYVKLILNHIKQVLTQLFENYREMG